MTLSQFAAQVEELDDATVAIRAQGPGAVKAVDNLRRLRRLELLTDDVVWSLIGQAPIDPHGLFALLQPLGAWAFSATDFCVIRVLAQKDKKPVALMRVDLLSDDVTFVVLRNGQLVADGTSHFGDHLAQLAKERGVPYVLQFLEQKAQEVIDEGLANV